MNDEARPSGALRRYGRDPVPRRGPLLDEVLWAVGPPDAGLRPDEPVPWATASMHIQKSLVPNGSGWTILPAIGVAGDVGEGVLSGAPLCEPTAGRRRPLDRRTPLNGGSTCKPGRPGLQVSTHHAYSPHWSPISTAGLYPDLPAPNDESSSRGRPSSRRDDKLVVQPVHMNQRNRRVKGDEPKR